MELSIFTIFKCPGWWHRGCPRCYVTIRAVRPRNYLPRGKLPVPPTPTPQPYQPHSAFRLCTFPLSYANDQLVNWLNPWMGISSCLFSPSCSEADSHVHPLSSLHPRRHSCVRPRAPRAPQLSSFSLIWSKPSSAGG